MVLVLVMVMGVGVGIIAAGVLATLVGREA
jgi:hypothetical protein